MMHEIEAECDLNDDRRRTRSGVDGHVDVAWTTNPIGFSERFTIRTDSHQHTNTNIGLHARTDREFLHSTVPMRDGPADNPFNTLPNRARGAAPPPGSRRCPEAARAGRPPELATTVRPRRRARPRGVIHTGRDAQGQAAPAAQPQTTNPTPKGTRMDGAIGRCGAPLVLVSLSSPAAAPPIQNGCHTSARPR